LASAWRVYLLEAGRDESLELVADAPLLVVTLLDKDGSAIKRYTKPLEDHGRTKRASGFRWLFAEREEGFPSKRGALRGRGEAVTPTTNVALAPFLLSAPSHFALVPGQAIRCRIGLSEDEVRRMKEIRCEVVFGKSKEQ
jgi:hypothetical protein